MDATQALVVIGAFELIVLYGILRQLASINANYDRQLKAIAARNNDKTALYDAIRDGMLNNEDGD
jgi:hypothetical protein